MFCNKCGTEVKDGAKFCPSCGAQAGAASPVSSGRPVAQAAGARGTSNAPLILGIIGSVLMLPGLACSVCAGGLFDIGSALANPSGSGGYGTTIGLIVGLVPMILGFVGAAKGKSSPTASFICLLLAALIAGIAWAVFTFFTSLFYLAALILYLIGAIIAMVQKREGAAA